MKTAVLDFYSKLGRRAAALRMALPRVDRRYVVAVLFVLPVLVLGPYVVPFILALAFFAALISFVFARVSRAGYSVWRAGVVLLAMVPFVGLTSSVENLPNWMQIVSHLFPVTYILEGVRTLITFGAFDAAAFVASVLLTGVYAFFVYLWASARAESKAQYGKLYYD